MNRQRLILAILLILLPLAALWSYRSYPRPKTVATLKYPPGTRAAAERRREPATTPPAPRPADGNTLRLDLLEREQPPFKGYRRNIFKPVFVDELKAMQQRAAAVKPPPPPVQPPKPLPAPPVAVPPQPRRELARFTFLGYLKRENRTTIFLAKDNEIILVRKGDLFAGRYEAASITDQALTIRVRDSGEEIVIPLMENRPLTAR